MTLSALWSAEPVAIVNTVRLCALAGMTFGLHLTDVQLGASMLALEAVLTLFTRSQVTSPATLNALTPATLQAAQDAPVPVKDTIKKLPVVLLAVALLGGSIACHAPVTITTPQGKTAYTADQIAVRVNELQNAAIQAEATGGLPTATTRTVVEFAVTADKILAATPAGWVSSLQTLWAQAKARIGTVTNPAIVAAMAAVDVALGSLS